MVLLLEISEDFRVKLAGVAPDIFPVCRLEPCIIVDAHASQLLDPLGNTGRYRGARERDAILPAGMRTCGERECGACSKKFAAADQRLAGDARLFAGLRDSRFFHQV